jgi:hypothetical protein
MMTSAPRPESSPLDVLRRFAKPRRPEEQCEMCANPLGREHEHLVEPSSRRLLCCCGACAILFEGGAESRFRRVPRRIERLLDFQLSDSQWESLHLPIQLAFFYKIRTSAQVLAFYPSPAGATESLLPLEAWQELEAQNPVLLELEHDVEALLVNRLGPSREHYRVPIDRCFALVGLLRTHWRGLSGGALAWQSIREFFDELRQRAHSRGEPSHAGLDV